MNAKTSRTTATTVDERPASGGTYTRGKDGSLVADEKPTRQFEPWETDEADAPVPTPTIVTDATEAPDA